MTSAPLFNHLLTAVGLAMDCTAIAVAYGLARQGRPGSVEIRLSLAFGLFQALLFMLGWFFGARFRDFMGGWDHWIAFAILAGIGGKMLWESFAGDGEARDWNLTWGSIALLALAASIDALAVGLGFSLVGTTLPLPALLIGLFSFLLPLAGYHGAARFGGRLGVWAERLGGIVLFAIGTRILVEHLVKGI